MPNLAFLLAATRQEDVINGEGMSKSTGLERHAYEAMILNLELAKSLLAGAVSSRNPCPFLCRRGDELTCGLDVTRLLFPGFMAEDDKGESGRARGRAQPG